MMALCIGKKATGSAMRMQVSTRQLSAEAVSVVKIAPTINAWDPRDESQLPPEFDKKVANGSSQYVFRRRIFRKQFKALRDDWRTEVKGWEAKDDTAREEWYKTLESFKAAKKAERERRSQVRADIRAKHDEKLNAINRYKGLMAAKRRWHTQQWKREKMTAMLDAMERESVSWPQWHNMDEILTPENFHKAVYSPWKDWEPSADLMRNVLLDWEVRKNGAFDTDAAVSLRKVLPYGSERGEVPASMMPPPDPYDEVKKWYAKKEGKSEESSKDPRFTASLISFSDVTEALQDTIDDWDLEAAEGSDGGQGEETALTDDNVDSFMGPNWTYHVAVRPPSARPGRPFPWGSGNPSVGSRAMKDQSNKINKMENLGLSSKVVTKKEEDV